MPLTESTPDHISLEHWDSLDRCGIVTKADDRANAGEVLNRRVTEETAARFFDWHDDNGRLEIARVEKEMSDGRLSHCRCPAMRMPRFSLRPITHRAIVLSNSQTTCRGLRPIDDVCAHVADIAYYWSTWSNAKLMHEIVVIDFGAQQVGTTNDTCGNVSPSIEVKSVDLDPAKPKESNTELCRIDAKLCNVPPPFPSPSPQATPTSTPSGPGRTPSTNTPTPQRTPNSRPPSTLAPRPTLTPTPAAVLRLRSLPGRRAAITEGCNQGRVIGEIGELDSVRLSLEAEVVAVPEDCQFLAQYGCIRVFSGILGDPSHGYAGYVQANDVCASPKNFDYWMAQPSMTTLPGRELLRRCPD